MSYDEERFVETWKSVIEFTKVLIGLSTSILTVILGLVVVGQIKINGSIVVTAGLLVLSIVFALFSFGRGIQALSKGESKRLAILFSNIGTIALVIGIVLLALSKNHREFSVDDILSKIASSTKLVGGSMTPEHFQSFKRIGDDCELTYSDNRKNVVVIFSVKDDEVKEVK